MNNFLILDLETGGLDKTKHAITQIAFKTINAETYVPIVTYETFVKPYNDLVVTPEALTHSRVSMKEVLAGIDSKLLVKELIAAFTKSKKGGPKGKPIMVGHNLAEFDMGFLEALFEYHNLYLYKYVSKNCIDTLLWCKLYEMGKLKSGENQKFNLTACCERYGIDLKGAHGAMTDVRATELLLIKLLTLFRSGDTTKNAKVPKEVRSRDSFFFEF